MITLIFSCNSPNNCVDCDHHSTVSSEETEAQICQVPYVTSFKYYVAKVVLQFTCFDSWWSTLFIKFFCFSDLDTCQQNNDDKIKLILAALFYDAITV